MRRAIYWLVFLLALCDWCGSEVEARALLLGETEQITAPRFAEGDLDGDGVNELIVGGRVGRFRALTDPFFTRSARVEVYEVRGGVLELRASSENLHVINDVTAGDLDGDGRAEVVAIGDARIYVLGYEAGRLEVSHTEVLAIGAMLDLDGADLDGDGRIEIAVAECRPESGVETVGADIHIYTFADGFQRQTTLELDQHVGDLCLGDFDGDNQVDLAFEQGSEEIGGVVCVYGFVSLQPYERFRQQLTPEEVRGLQLTIEKLDGRALLGVGDIRGQVTLWRTLDAGLAPIGELLLPRDSGPLHGLHLTTLFDASRVQLISGTAPAGAGKGRLWMVEGVGF